jgi:hypothetical protein
MAPASPETAEPARNSIPPEFDVSLDPVATTTRPESPETALPVAMDMLPLETSSTSPGEVFICTLPELSIEP